MNYTGNTDYKQIKDKQFLTVDSNNSAEIITELNKQSVPYSARYDEAKLTVTFSKDDFEKVNSVINSFNKGDSNETQNNSVDIAIEELKKQVREMAEKQQELEKLAEEQKAEVKKPTTEAIEQNNNTVSSEEIDTNKSTFKILPIISTAVVKQEQRIEELYSLRQISENKITRHQECIEKLTARAERLATTNQMLDELINNKSTPNAVKDSIRAVIKANEQKIQKIRDKKIPSREEKIEKRQSKIERIDKKINLAKCKINRYKSFNQVITSFSLVNNAERRVQFTNTMDELHNNSIALLNAKIDNSTATIEYLIKLQKEAPVLAAATGNSQDLIFQKIKRQQYINKRNKLMGVIIPYVSQPEKVQNEVLQQTESIINETSSKETISAAEIADKVVLSALPALPEKSIVEPDPTKDMSLLPEIAQVMDMSVSELESKPMDIKSMLILDYTNHFDSSLEAIQESLSNIISPNIEVEKNIEESKQKENPLKNAEELIEGNANMIDGIINNEPPKKEDPKPIENTEKKTFYFGRSSMNKNAQKIANEHRVKSKEKDPPNHYSL